MVICCFSDICKVTSCAFISDAIYIDKIHSSGVEPSGMLECEWISQQYWMR
jgi:hypothetical protein